MITSKPPTARQVLQMLDEIVDTFNGDENQNFLLCRRARWRKSDKYMAEDIDDCMNAFLYCCGDLNLPSRKIPAFKLALAECVKVNLASTSDFQYRAEYRQFLKESIRELARQPHKPVYPRENHLWLRAIIATAPRLAAPIPLWPLYLQQSLDRARQNYWPLDSNWTRSNHEDAVWARETLIKQMKKKGWFNSKKPPKVDDHTEENIEWVADKIMDNQHIRKLGPADRQKLNYDPIAEQWKTSQQLYDEQLDAPVFVSKAQVITQHESWNPEETTKAHRFARAVVEKEMALPPKPRARMGL